MRRKWTLEACQISGDEDGICHEDEYRFRSCRDSRFSLQGGKLILSTCPGGK